MISHTHNFIFIHIPKTGGSSVDSVLKKYVRRFVLHEYLYPNVVHKAEKRNGFLNYFSFCFVRNPWDKIVSQYHFNREKFGMENYTFEEYVYAYISYQILGSKFTKWLLVIRRENVLCVIKLKN